MYLHGNEGIMKGTENFLTGREIIIKNYSYKFCGKT